MPEPISAGIVVPLLNFALKSLQTGFEIAGVPQATSDHLQTINQVLSDIQTARDLRNEKRSCMSDDEIVKVDAVIHNTEQALAGLEQLVERARVDMQLHTNVRTQARIMWVMRDAGMASAALSRLSLTSQSLHGEITNMRLKPSHPQSQPYTSQPPLRPLSHSQSDFNVSAPAHLQESNRARAERREWLDRRYSMNARSNRSGTSHVQYPRPVAPVVLQESEALQVTRRNVERWIQDNESELSDLDHISYACPPEGSIHARVVESDDEWSSPPLPSISELEADTYHPGFTQSSQRFSSSCTAAPPAAGPNTSQPLARLTSVSDWMSPTMALQEDPVINRPQPSPVGFGTSRPNSVQPRQRAPARVAARTQSSDARATSSARHLAAQTPGRGGQRMITWDESDSEEGEEIPLNRQPTPDITESPPPYTPVAAPNNVPLARVGTSRAAGMQGRRAPRSHCVQNTPNAAVVGPPESPDVSVAPSLTSGPGTVRSHRNRRARSQWALDQQEAEEAGLNRSGRSSPWS